MTGDPTAPEAPAWSLDDLKVRLAWGKALAQLGADAEAQARADWEATAAHMRNHDGTKSTGLRIGDLDLGLIKFPANGGGTSTHGAVVERLAREAPAGDDALERWAEPSILERADVLDTLEAFHPGLVQTRARRSWKARLLARLDPEGRLVDEQTGTFEQVQTHHTATSTGQITFTPADRLTEAMVGLMRSGQIDLDTVRDLLPFFPGLTAIPGHVEPAEIEAPRAEAA
jgi:hypothetical protein